MSYIRLLAHSLVSSLLESKHDNVRNSATALLAYVHVVLTDGRSRLSIIETLERIAHHYQLSADERRDLIGALGDVELAVEDGPSPTQKRDSFGSDSKLTAILNLGQRFHSEINPSAAVLREAQAAASFKDHDSFSLGDVEFRAPILQVSDFAGFESCRSE